MHIPLLILLYLYLVFRILCMKSHQIFHSEIDSAPSSVASLNLYEGMHRGITTSHITTHNPSVCNIRIAEVLSSDFEGHICIFETYA